MKDIEDFKDEWRNEADSEMKTYIIRAEKKAIGYYTIKAKSLEEAKAQAMYQMAVRPTTAMETSTCDEIKLPKESMVIDEDYLEFTGKEKENETS
tara:strand:+ start:3130 stop:3414 length:285 start_codon:yes stop_codon:yes gene_type:complete